MLSQFLIICLLTYPSISSRTLALEANRTAAREYARFGCAQHVEDQAAIIREAETNGYAIRRLEFVGNERISDGVLRKKVRPLQEGEKFRRSNLVASLAKVSRLKIIHPVRLSDVVLRLEESDKLVDIVICFNEKDASSK
jgi:outer membrane protein assembly factor BamA